MYFGAGRNEQFTRAGGRQLHRRHKLLCSRSPKGRLKMQDQKMEDEFAGLENGGLENAGQKNGRPILLALLVTYRLKSTKQHYDSIICISCKISFPLLHFPVLHFLSPAFSCPAFSAFPRRIVSVASSCRVREMSQYKFFVSPTKHVYPFPPVELYSAFRALAKRLNARCNGSVTLQPVCLFRSRDYPNTKPFWSVFTSNKQSMITRWSTRSFR